MKLLEDYLRSHAAAKADKVALVCGSESVTYRQLYENAVARATLLKENDAQAIVTRATQTVDFLTAYFAAHLAGKAIVPLENTAPDSLVNEIELLVKNSNVPDDVADILFTTGTTGKPKGTMIAHSAIIANAENLIEAQGFTDEHTFVISGPLNHIGSLSKIWPMTVVGGTVIITEGMKDLEAFFHALDYPSAKMATFLVPASLRMLMLLSKERLGGYTSKLDFIETGAAPMSQSDMEELCSILPKTRLYNTYASTETGIVSTHDYQNDGCIAGCLGKPMRHSEVIIGKNGIITCKGATLMKGYVGNAELTNSILCNGALHTSDLGHFDTKGRLRLDGRTDDMINVGGFKISPVEIEGIVMKCKGVADCICVAASHPILGNALKLIYTAESGNAVDRKMLVAYLKQHLESHKIPTQYEQTDKIQRTYNGKLDRKFYR